MYAGPGRPEEFLAKIDADGHLLSQYRPQIPLRQFEWVGYLSLAASGRSVGLLASLVSGGQDQTVEGAFFAPVGAEGFGAPKRVAGRGPQFPTLIGAGSGQFIAAGDQEPLTVLKLDGTGSLLWKRSFSRKLVLPVVAVSANGGIFVLSQGGSYILLQLLDTSGRVLRSKQISAEQGTVSADPGGGCSVLFSTGPASKDNRVFLATFDRTLHELHRVNTPFRGIGGRTYQLISTPTGHLGTGESSEATPVIADFDQSGQLRWQQAISSRFVPFLVPLPSGFYMITDLLLLKGHGTDIQKYSY